MMENRLPVMGARMPFNLPLNWYGQDFGWRMGGYYQTTASSLGNSRLQIYGQLTSPNLISPDHDYTAYCVIGNTHTTEWFKTNKRGGTAQWANIPVSRAHG